MNDKIKNTDRQIKKKIEKYEFEFSDHAWDNMEALLDRPPPTSRRFLFTIPIFVIMTLLMIVLYFFGLPNAGSVELSAFQIEQPTEIATIDTYTATIDEPAILPATTDEKKTASTRAPRAIQQPIPKAFENYKNFIPGLPEILFTSPLTTLSGTQTPDSSFVRQLMAQLNTTAAHYAPEKVYLHFDRLLFAPGEAIWFNAYLRDANTFKASNKSELIYIQLISPSGSVAKELTLIAKNGSVRGDFQLADNISGGIYKVKAYTKWQQNLNTSFEREVQVQSSVLPNLLMELDFKRKAYGAASKVEATFKVNSLENEPLANYNFVGQAMLDGQPIKVTRGKTNKRGEATVKFKLPKKLETTNGLLNIAISYNGQTESIARNIPLVLNTIDLQFLPEGGDMIEGMPTKVAFKALNEYGKPADIRGAIYNEAGVKQVDFSSYHQGMGAFNFTPQAKEKYYAVLTEPAGIINDYFLPEALPRGYGLEVIKQDEKYITLAVHSTETEKLTVVLRTRGEVYQAITTPAEKGTHQVQMAIEDAPIGIAELTLFDKKEIPRSERLIFLNPERRLDIQIRTHKKQYLPREKVEMTVEVKDERGMPMPGLFSLAVVDDNLLTYADDKQGGVLAYMLLESELRGKIEEPNFYFESKEEHPDKDQLLALDYLMLTQGWRRFAWNKIQQENLAVMNHPSEKAEIKGRVVNVLNQPLANVEVQIEKGNLRTFTDENGQYLLSGVPIQEGQVQVKISKEDMDQSFLAKQFGQQRDVLLYSVQGHQSKVEVQKIQATGNGFVRGTMKDADTGEGLIGATVVLGGTKNGAVTDFDGNFEIRNVPPGEYELQFNYIGYDKVFEKIEVKDQEGVIADADMVVAGELLSEVVITEYKVPLIEKDNTTSGATITAEDIRTLPTKNISALSTARVKAQPDKAGNLITIRGSRAEGTDYFIDGIRINKKNQLKNKRNQIQLDDKELAGNEKRDQRESEIRKFKIQEADKKRERTYAQNFSKGFYQSREFYTPKYDLSESVEVRNDFRSTIYWNPAVEVDRKGIAKLEFYTSDALTSFRTTVEGFSADGGLGQGVSRFFSQKPIGMRTKLPTQLLIEDEFMIPVSIANNTDEAITGNLELQLPEGITLLKSLDKRYKLKAGESQTIFLSCRADQAIAEGKIGLRFLTDGFSDASEETIKVLSRGFPVSEVFADNQQERTFEIDLQAPLDNSVEASFSVYPNVLGDLVTGLDRMLRQPTGCFEQTSSKNYPNLLALDFLQHSGQENPAVANRAKQLVAQGYDRLLTFEVVGGGFDWYGRPPAHEALTAYGLMQFHDMKAVHPVSPDLIDRTAKWLLSRRDGKGGWLNGKGALHSWQGESAISNAYICWALAEAGYGSQIKQELEKMYENAVQSEDPYLMALAVNALHLQKDKRADLLLQNCLLLQDANGSWNGLTTSMTHSGGKSLMIETTALTVLAILKTGEGTERLADAIQFIAQSKNGYGFGSTQSTVLAMKALVAYAKYFKGGENTGEVALEINGKKIMQKKLDATQKEPLQLKDLGTYLKPGKNIVKVRFTKTDQACPYDFALQYATRQPKNAAECKVNLDTKWTQSKVKMGDQVQLTTVLRNRTDVDIPNTIAKVGIPAGLTPQPWQLKEMQEKGVFDYYELMEGYIVFHYRGMKADAVKEIKLDFKADIPGVFEAPASVAYLYYTNEHQHWTKPERVDIQR